MIELGQKLLTPAEVSELLGINQRHLKLLREEEGIPYLRVSERVYRYPASMVVNWANARGSWPREEQLEVVETKSA